MQKPKVAIFENDPTKEQAYRDAVKKAGGEVVWVVRRNEDIKDRVLSFSEDPATTPDVVLTDALLDPDAYKDALDKWEVRKNQADRLGQRWPDMPLTDGERIARAIHMLQDPTRQASLSSGRDMQAKGELGEENTLPEAANVPTEVKVIGISDGLAVTSADIKRATPQQVTEYLQQL